MNNLEQSANSGIEQAPYNVIQHGLTNIIPTASEIGQLWTSYLAESMSRCMLQYFVEKAKDPNIKPVLQRALDVSSQRIDAIAQIFNSVQCPVPHGFTDEDFDVNAKELFSETFALTYTRMMNKYVLIDYSLALSMSSRQDIYSYFEGSIDTAKEIIGKANEVMLGKGIFVRPPSIVMPDRVDYVHNKNFYGLVFGSQRPINSLEISHVYANIESKLILEALNLGLSQVVKSKKVKDYISRGKHISDKQVEVLNNLLENDGLPTPVSSDFHITNSTESPFSDKLILCHVTIVTAFSMTGFGLGLAQCSRKDITLSFTRLVAELLDYSKSGADMMIENGWLEKVPENFSQKEMAH
ncbi:MAG: DUF3231 family protein [Desulfitobacteriaceae bacterium]